MNLCIPVDENLGLKSVICLHFGTALKLMVVDSKTLSFEIYENPDRARKDPAKILQFLSQHLVKSVVVGGIGIAMLDRLNTAGISVFSSKEDTVADIVQAYNKGTINPVTLGASCQGPSGGRNFSIPTCRVKFGGRNSGSCSGGC